MVLLAAVVVTTTMVVVVMIVTATVVVVLVIVGRLRRRFHVGRRHRTHGRLFALSQFAFHVEIEVDLLHDEAGRCNRRDVWSSRVESALVANPGWWCRISCNHFFVVG